MLPTGQKRFKQTAWFNYYGLSMVIFILCSFPALGDFPNTNMTYANNVKTVLLYKKGFEMSAPVIVLNSGEKVVLSFDDLDGDLKRYKYTIVHCEADWTTSADLTENDWISGFREDDLYQYTYSYNTTVHYTHYSLEFPATNMQPKISGNYIFKVFLDDPSNVILTRRFMVLEQSPAGITGDAHQTDNTLMRFTGQQVDFVLHFNGMIISDPTRELKVIVTQNDRLDNAMVNLKPKFSRGDELDYNYNGEYTFAGGNEFRAVDIKSLVYQTENIRKIESDTGGIEVYLLDDKLRTTKNYVSDKDINGRMLIKSEDHAQNSDIEADYAWVHFLLPTSTYFPNGKIYILGALIDWQMNEKSSMAYNPFLKGYEKRLLLKQGYYNYIYVFKDNKTGIADAGLIEGNHWETENVYTVWVYYHETGGMYDRLIAVQNLRTLH